MSRALTVWSRKEAAAKTDGDEVERVMASQGCSEPVAKNLLKYAKLGIGPLATAGAGTTFRGGDDGAREGSRLEQYPPRLDRKQAALLAEQKLRERQEQEEEAELFRSGSKKKKSGMARLGPVMARADEVDPFRAQPAARSAAPKAEDEQKSDDEKDTLGGLFNPRLANGRPMGKKPMQIAGISRLGAVMARVEEVDPLEVAVASKADDEEEEDEYRPEDEPTTEQQYDRLQDKKRLQAEEERNRGTGKKKRRRRGRGGSSENSDEEDHKESKRARSESPVDTGASKASSAGRPAYGDKSYGDKSHGDKGHGDKAAGSGGSLMSEAQVKAMMNKERKGNPDHKRGSVRAQSRIQKEKMEWELAKANNPEFWKAPQFALCYSAETGKKARGAG